MREHLTNVRGKFVDMALIYCVNEVSNVAHVTIENSQF
jgi:hypothetical protein